MWLYASLIRSLSETERAGGGGGWIFMYKQYQIKIVKHLCAVMIFYFHSTLNAKIANTLKSVCCAAFVADGRCYLPVWFVSVCLHKVQTKRVRLMSWEQHKHDCLVGMEEKQQQQYSGKENNLQKTLLADSPSIASTQWLTTHNDNQKKKRAKKEWRKWSMWNEQTTANNVMDEENSRWSHLFLCVVGCVYVR